MANEDINIRIRASTTGVDGIKGLKSELGGLSGKTQQFKAAWSGVAVGLGAAGAAFWGVSRAAGAAYSALKEGAAIERTKQRFDNLAETLNMTGASLRHGLREATRGMVSDMELMESASQMVSLGLATTADETIRLTRLTGELGWNMQQLVLTLANMSTMRLDALGLSVAAVTGRAKELELQGMAASEAFKTAVIEAGEAKLAIEGSIADSTAGALAQGEAAWANFWTMMKEGAAGFAEGIGLIGMIEGHAEASSALTDLKDRLNELVAQGKLTEEQATALARAWQFGGEAHARAADTVNRLEAALQAERAATVAAAEAADLLRLGLASSDQQMLNSAARMEFLAESGMRAAAALAEAAYVAATAWGASSSVTEGYWRQGALAAERYRDAAARTGQTFYEMGGYRIPKATRALGGFSSALDDATQRQQAFASAFQAELSTELNLDIDNDALRERQKIIDEGLIGNNGLANMTAINAALYEQAGAAGATAGQLALLGLATGQFTEEQARAALKAAVLQEKIKQMAAAISSGAIGYGDAVAGLGDFASQLDTAGAESSIEDLAATVDEYATGGPYVADVGADTDTAAGRLRDVITLLDDIDGRKVTAAVNVEGATAAASGASGGSANPPVIPYGGAAYGGSVKAGDVTWVGERGPELVIWQRDATVVPHGKDAGRGVTVNVTNYVNGQPQRSELDTITEDRMKAALRSLSL